MPVPAPAPSAPAGIDIQGKKKKKREPAGSPLTSSVQENVRGFTYHGESVVPAAAGMLADARGGVDEDVGSPQEEDEVNTDDELADERPVGRYARRRDDEDHLDGFDEAVARLNAVETARGVTVFAVGAGPRVNYQQLARLSLQRSPAPLEGLKYQELFEWLSASLSNVSNSSEFGHSDADLGGEGIPLPSVSGWTSA